MGINLGRIANINRIKLYLYMTYPNLRDSNVLTSQQLMMLLVQLNIQFNCHYANDIIDGLS